MPDIARNWSPARWRTAARAGAVVLPLLVCAVLHAVRDDVTAATGVLILVLLVVGAAATGDRIAGLLAAISAGLWFDYFLAPPYLTFAITDRDDIEATVLLVLISIAVTEVALWGRRQQAGASRRAGYLDGVLGAAQAVSEGEAPRSAVLDLASRQITEVLAADSIRFVEGPVSDPRVAVLDHDGVLTRNGHAVDVDRVGLPSDEYVAIPVRRGSRVVGHFLLTATATISYPSREQRRVAVLLADQVSGALEAPAE
jgi:K+-sensing histidine kinase KdpD